MAMDELKRCVLEVPNRYPRRKTAITAVKVIIVLFILPPKLKVCATENGLETHLNKLVLLSQGKQENPRVSGAGPGLECWEGQSYSRTPANGKIAWASWAPKTDD